MPGGVGPADGQRRVVVVVGEGCGGRRHRVLGAPDARHGCTADAPQERPDMPDVLAALLDVAENGGAHLEFT